MPGSRFRTVLCSQLLWSLVPSHSLSDVVFCDFSGLYQRICMRLLGRIVTLFAGHRTCLDVSVLIDKLALMLRWGAILCSCIPQTEADLCLIAWLHTSAALRPLGLFCLLALTALFPSWTHFRTSIALFPVSSLFCNDDGRLAIHGWQLTSILSLFMLVEALKGLSTPLCSCLFARHFLHNTL